MGTTGVVWVPQIFTLTPLAGVPWEAAPWAFLPCLRLWMGTHGRSWGMESRVPTNALGPDHQSMANCGKRQFLRHIYLCFVYIPNSYLWSKWLKCHICRMCWSLRIWMLHSISSIGLPCNSKGKLEQRTSCCYYWSPVYVFIQNLIFRDLFLYLSCTNTFSLEQKSGTGVSISKTMSALAKCPQIQEWGMVIKLASEACRVT